MDVTKRRTKWISSSNLVNVWECICVTIHIKLTVKINTIYSTMHFSLLLLQGFKNTWHQIKEWRDNLIKTNKKDPKTFLNVYSITTNQFFRHSRNKSKSKSSYFHYKVENTMNFSGMWRMGRNCTSCWLRAGLAAGQQFHILIL